MVLFRLRLRLPLHIFALMDLNFFVHLCPKLKNDLPDELVTKLACSTSKIIYRMAMTQCSAA